MNVPGYFGKIPSLGDFVTRRLPTAFIEPWDQWLQTVIADSRQQFGENWLELYLTSPVWNFVLSRSLCGEHPWMGVLMPSVDRVGRYFPLTIACQLPLDSNPLDVASREEDWFSNADSVILSVLTEQSIDVEQFDTQVTVLGGAKPILSGMNQVGVGYGSAWQIPKAPDQKLSVLFPLVAHQMLMQRLGEYSLWWATGSAHVNSSLLICSGLPARISLAL